MHNLRLQLGCSEFEPLRACGIEKESGKVSWFLSHCSQSGKPSSLLLFLACEGKLKCRVGSSSAISALHCSISLSQRRPAPPDKQTLTKPCFFRVCRTNHFTLNHLRFWPNRPQKSQFEAHSPLAGVCASFTFRDRGISSQNTGFRAKHPLSAVATEHSFGRAKPYFMVLEKRIVSFPRIILANLNSLRWFDNEVKARIPRL